MFLYLCNVIIFVIKSDVLLFLYTYFTTASYTKYTCKNTFSSSLVCRKYKKIHLMLLMYDLYDNYCYFKKNKKKLALCNH